MGEPRFSEKDLQNGRALLSKKKIKQLLFSEGTYQAEVSDLKGHQSFWPFLHVDDKGKILDSFCTCKPSEKEGKCPHTAAAYLSIFQGGTLPIHVRFRASIWNCLCQIAQRRGEQNLQGSKEKGYEALSPSGKRLIYLRGKTAFGKKKIESILHERVVETEETSIKFSNLSAEEINDWKKGHPSSKLQYELSFWSDLAKWWMLNQAIGQTAKISFEKENGLPHWIALSFPDVEAGFYIAEANFSQIIPALQTIPTSLHIANVAENIEKITYDSARKELHLAFSNAKQKHRDIAVEKGIPIGDFVYIPKKGFYLARNDPFLEKEIISTHEIGAFLSKHTALAHQKLVDISLHIEPHSVCYFLKFDAASTFHLACYLFEKGDLQKENSAYFSPWAFIKGKGFYRLENVLFETLETAIPEEKVSDFISRHRIWLQGFVGFQTHLATLEPSLAYTLLQDEALQFESRLALGEEMEKAIDFGEWIYVPNKGFFPKIGRMGGSIRGGLIVPARDVGRFLHLHQEELEQVKGFFTSYCPIEKSGLHIGLNEQGRIVVRPQFFLDSLYQRKKTRAFGDYFYVEGEGFSLIPSDKRLPEAYLQETTINPIDEPYFVAYELDVLRPLALSIDKRLSKPQDLRIALLNLQRDEKGWLAELEYRSDEGKFPIFDVWTASHQNKRYLFSDAGLIFLRGPRFQWLQSISKKNWLKKGKVLRLSALEWIRLNVYDEVAPPTRLDAKELFDELKYFRSSLPLDLSGLQSKLRPYQETGLLWLWFLYSQKLSGLLCDEMGLGKTHQAMALIAAAHNQNKAAKFLVVCPTSVIYHWEGLLRRFLPSIRVSIFYGIQRSLESFEQDFDLIVTSYGTLRSEQKALSNIFFHIAVFDEAQIAKNIHSQTHRALKKIRAKMIAALTGTPIENRLLELKALFDLILPTYLPIEKVFRDLFVNPIEKNQDPERKALLARLIQPFILRRKKTEVLTELPEKVEEIAYCDLSEEQRLLYRAVFREKKEALLQQLLDKTKPAPYLHIFSLLSKLKQICDHPCLVTKNIEEYEKHHSGKWDLFVELLEETRDSGQKLVVFSQYLDMLNIIEFYLKQKGIGYAGIRGSTKDRKAQIEKFHNDPSCEVFVGSLQAAGVGIDLIAASVVIHYDRWWNPAKENQATDRVHRIGQSRNVQVFKMVTKHTIEERIHEIIDAKVGLLEILGFDEQDHIKGLEREELLDLLRWIDREME